MGYVERRSGKFEFHAIPFRYLVGEASELELSGVTIIISEFLPGVAQLRLVGYKQSVWSRKYGPTLVRSANLIFKIR